MKGSLSVRQFQNMTVSQLYIFYYYLLYSIMCILSALTLESNIVKACTKICRSLVPLACDKRRLTQDGPQVGVARSKISPCSIEVDDEYRDNFCSPSLTLLTSPCKRTILEHYLFFGKSNKSHQNAFL